MTNAHHSVGTAGPSAEPPQREHPAHQRAVALYGPRFQNNPAQLYRDIRRQHGPVAPILLEGDVPAWLVLGYRELLEVTGNSQLFARDSRRWNAWHRVPADWPLLPILVHLNNLGEASTKRVSRRRAGSAPWSDAVVMSCGPRR